MGALAARRRLLERDDGLARASRTRVLETLTPEAVRDAGESTESAELAELVSHAL